MQAYMEQVECECPVYGDITSGKVDEKFNRAFDDSMDLITWMKDYCKKNSTIVMIGLWPLDFVSYNDWRQSTHVRKLFPEYVMMARIEMHIVGEYHVDMFQECPAAAYIWLGLASTLREACKAKAWDLLNAKTGKMEKKMVGPFVYVDHIRCNGAAASGPPKVNVVDLKQNQKRVEREESLAAETIALLKKIENFRGSMAAPGSNKIDKGVAEAVTYLHKVHCLSNLCYPLITHIQPGLPGKC